MRSLDFISSASSLAQKYESRLRTVSGPRGLEIIHLLEEQQD
jgi:hypothetical protein